MSLDLTRQLLLACHRAGRVDRIMPDLPKGLGARHIRALNALISLEKERTGQPTHVGEIADALGLTRPTVTRTVTDLEALGLVAKTPGATDGRAVAVTATPAGHDVHRTYDVDFHTRVAAALKTIPEADVETTIRTLAEIERLLVDVGAPAAKGAR